MRNLRRGKGCRDSSGQGLVEFALVFPVIVFLLFGVFDLGRAVYAYNTIANAARQGARIAAVNQIATSPDCVQSRPVEDPANPHWSIKTCAAAAAVSLGVQASAVTVTYSAPTGSTLTCNQTSPQVGCLAEVAVHYNYVPMTPVISNLVGSLTLDSSSSMLVERTFP